MESPTIIETQSAEEFEKQAVDFIKEAIAKAIADHGSCILGLSGGSTPGPIYTALSQDTSIDWSAVHIFLVDDRCVPADHSDSNQRLVRESLLMHIAMLQENIHFPNTALPIKKCVSDYENQLQSLFEKHTPDLVILGMGEDGHTASLFPDNKEAVEEKTKLVLHTITETFAVRDRITVTIPVLLNAQARLFLAKGDRKKNKLDEMLSSPEDYISYPIQAVMQRSTTWIVEV